MKKKVLTMLLAATMTATVGSPICAADFTSGTENVEAFSESIMEGKEASKDAADVDAVNGEADAAEEPGDPEETDIVEFAAGESIGEGEETPEFNDGQEDILTDSAEAPSTSVTYPSMKKTTGNAYTATLNNSTENDYVKFVPQKTGKYVLKKAVTSNGYTNTSSVYSVYNSAFKQVKDVSQTTYSCYKLEKGQTYYLESTTGSKVVFQAELLTSIVSVKVSGIKKSTVFYTPIDFYQNGSNRKQYNIAERWRGKLKITYSDGKTETISTTEQNKYGEYVSRYVVYNGGKSSPEAGTYDVHLKFEGSSAEAVVKNVKVKKLSGLPTISGSGTKTVSIGSSGVYVRLKTGKSKKYSVSVSFPKYNLGSQSITIMQEKNGTLRGAGSVSNGKTCTLKANTVYYFYVNIRSGWKTNSTATFKVTPKN